MLLYKFNVLNNHTDRVYNGITVQLYGGSMGDAIDRFRSLMGLDVVFEASATIETERYKKYTEL